MQRCGCHGLACEQREAKQMRCFLNTDPELITQEVLDYDSERCSIESYLQQVKEEITRGVSQTEFNTRKLLNVDYENSPIKIQVGANARQTIAIHIGGMDSARLSLDQLDITT